MKPTKQLESAAYHAAGHAVMAWVQSVEIKKATIVQDGDTLGHVHHDSILKDANPVYEVSDRVQCRIEKSIRVSLAGRIAERILNHKGVRYTSSPGDMENAADLIFRLASDEREAQAYSKLLDIQTELMLKKRWRQVRDLAEALLFHGTLNRREIRQVLKDSMNVVFEEAKAERSS